MLDEEERSKLASLSETSRKHGYLVCLVNSEVFPTERFNMACLDADDIYQLACHTNVRVSIECFADCPNMQPVNATETEYGRRYEHD